MKHQHMVKSKKRSKSLHPNICTVKQVTFKYEFFKHLYSMIFEIICKIGLSSLISQINKLYCTVFLFTAQMVEAFLKQFCKNILKNHCVELYSELTNTCSAESLIIASWGRKTGIYIKILSVERMKNQRLKLSWQCSFNYKFLLKVHLNDSAMTLCRV